MRVLIRRREQNARGEPTRLLGGLVLGIVFTGTLLLTGLIGTPAAYGLCQYYSPENADCDAPLDQITQVAAPGETVSTNNLTSSTNPVATSVTIPTSGTGGTVSIEEKTNGQSLPTPTGFSFMNTQVTIAAPDATIENPLTIKFVIDPSLADLTLGDPSRTSIFWEGQQVPACAGVPNTANPDPCVSERVLDPNDRHVEITVLTSKADSSTATQTASAGATVSTYGDTPTATNAVITSVETPVDGKVAIKENSPSQQPLSSAYEIFGQAIDITAPDGTVENPLILKFKFDSSVIPAGESADTIQLLRNGTPVPTCKDPSKVIADDDPCVFKRMSLDGGDVEIDAYTSKASEWAVAAFHYDFTGFSPPVDNEPTLNTLSTRASKGAIPVKFSLSGDQGLNIYADGSPSSKDVICPSKNTMTDAIEETVAVPSAATGVTTYDSSKDKYTFAWQIDPTWKGTCRELNVKLIDGSQHKAIFKFVS